MLTAAVHCTYRYVQLTHWFRFCLKLAEFMNFQWTSAVPNSVMHWRICTFLDVSAALLYIVHWNQANALIVVEILVVVKCLVNMKHCSDFYAGKEFILCVWDEECCWVSKVSSVGHVRKMFWVNLRGLSNFGEQLFRKIIWKFILNLRRTLGYIKEGKTSLGSTAEFKLFICYIVIV